MIIDELIYGIIPNENGVKRFFPLPEYIFIICIIEFLFSNCKNVFFNEQWVDYNQRHNYLLNATIGVSTHYKSLETQFSFRTRLLDHFWVGLPTICTEGDSLAEVISANKAGITVPIGDVDAWVSALDSLIKDEKLRTELSRNALTLGASYTWNKVLTPLYKFIKTATPAPDRLLMPDLLGEKRFANPYLANFPRLNSASLLTATELLKDKGIKALLKKIIKKLIGRK